VGGSFTCTCNSGYSGNGVSCSDVNECALGTDNCHGNAGCKNVAGSFTCTCNSGYSGNGVSCSDVDECALGTHNCHGNATCKNVAGSFTCTCNSGYGGDGVSCSDVDECALGTDNCADSATCTNTVGSFGCTCQGSASNYCSSGSVLFATHIPKTILQAQCDLFCGGSGKLSCDWDEGLIYKSSCGAYSFTTCKAWGTVLLSGLTPACHLAFDITCTCL
jgi:hypothetical protein